MAYRATPSRTECVVLGHLNDSGFVDVTAGRLRRWYRNGLPPVPELAVEFALLIQALGRRHSDHALLVLAGRHPDAFDAASINVILDRWFERHYGALPRDLTRGVRCVYAQLSRAGSARRRASGMTLAEELARDLRAAGYDTSDPAYLSVSPTGKQTFNARTYIERWIEQIPVTRETLERTDAPVKLRALHEGYVRATRAGHPYAAPQAALDVLCEQSATRPMTASERVGLIASLAAHPAAG